MNHRHLMFLSAAVLSVGAVSTPAAPVQWTIESGGNGHWYEHVPAPGIFNPTPWATARSEALARTHLGLPGYLATVTSSAEQAFIESLGPFLVFFGGGGSVYLGGSDAAIEGEWRWLDGPEAGQLFTFTDWAGGQPNPTPGNNSDFLSLFVSFGVANGWVSFGSGGAGGYVVEFSPIPEPAAWGLLPAGLALVAAWRLRRRST